MGILSKVKLLKTISHKRKLKMSMHIYILKINRLKITLL